MQLEEFLEKLQTYPLHIEFEETIGVIEAIYYYTPTTFRNGSLTNKAGENEGSCKIFAFAKLQEFSEAQTLACFGKYYREDVLNDPDGASHQNIRNFIQNGWGKIRFDGTALIPR